MQRLLAALGVGLSLFCSTAAFAGAASVGAQPVLGGVSAPSAGSLLPVQYYGPPPPPEWGPPPPPPPPHWGPPPEWGAPPPPPPPFYGPRPYGPPPLGATCRISHSRQYGMYRAQPLGSSCFIPGRGYGRVTP
ncbi:hypothetical protein SAMN05216548_104128 [Faunimonas pinastri]|uniref:Uncharacterized protein n=1 Tax=Faunimonas pinastri TaxID=1855383 RepID=A0A1H9FIG1_9HYPH|nr:hypothetical protein [Faunimonas pinastri]SEQ37697.1 hypothetical protein SAMN05216548_104128 [Faunimonas pinastri]